MQNNKKLIMFGLVMAAALSIGAISSVSAYRGDFSQMGPNYSPERHATMERAFATNDYNLWKSQMGNRGITNKINESNFAKFAQMRNLMREGKFDEANRIRGELGLATGRGMGMNGGNCPYNNQK